jgi:dUTP pyrophosphatase
MKLKVKRINKRAKLPTKAYTGDAGLDLYCKENMTVFPGQLFGVYTGISVEIPEGYVGLIWDKSGVSRRGLHILAGVVDSGYRGEVIVVMKHLGESIESFNEGDKVAQMVIQPVATCVDIEEVKELSSSERGEGGFGSSGR